MASLLDTFFNDPSRIFNSAHMHSSLPGVPGGASGSVAEMLKDLDNALFGTTNLLDSVNISNYLGIPQDTSASSTLLSSLLGGNSGGKGLFSDLLNISSIASSVPAETAPAMPKIDSSSIIPELLKATSKTRGSAPISQEMANVLVPKGNSGKSAISSLYDVTPFIEMAANDPTLKKAGKSGKPKSQEVVEQMKAIKPFLSTEEALGTASTALNVTG